MGLRRIATSRTWSAQDDRRRPRNYFCKSLRGLLQFVERRCAGGCRIPAWRGAHPLAPHLSVVRKGPIMSNIEAADAFRNLITQYSYKNEDHDLLTNVSFFVGAGFSKAWDSTAPTGNDLFTFTREFLEHADSEIDE